MRAILEVRWGMLHGTRAILEPGMTLRVGRISGPTRAQFDVAHDRQMSTSHFELSWDGATCLLRDLRSAKGTFLGGERVTEARVPHGGWIKAGTTNFMVYLEEWTAPRIGADTTMTERKAKALAVLEAEDEPLFAVMDAGRNDRILELLRESVEDHKSLYEGVKGDAMCETAPYLVRLPKGSRLLRRLVVEGWGKRWGIFLATARPFKEVRTHLRRSLMVACDGVDAPWYFRFYDPGALRVVMPAWSPRTRARFFGEIGAFLVEGKASQVLRFDPSAAAEPPAERDMAPEDLHAMMQWDFMMPGQAPDV